MEVVSTASKFMQPETLDPQAVNLAKAIRQTESGGDFTAPGKSGEYGAYQYTEPTWQKDSTEAGVNVPLRQATPEQQNEVAYKKIKSLKDSGMNVGQIASVWNSGDSEAYTGKFSDGRPATGVNKFGAKYDVPAYTKSIATAYQKLKQGEQVQADPNNPSSTANPTPLQNPADTQSAQQYGASYPAKTGEGPLQAGLKAVGNLPSSGVNLAKGIGNILAHPIKTGEGVLGGLFGSGENIGQAILTRLGGPDKGTDEFQQQANAIGKAIKDRYGSLENAQRSATNDPIGVGTDIFTALEGGASMLDAGMGTTREGLQATEAANNAKGFLDTGINVMPKAPESGLAEGILNKGLGTVAKPVVAGIKGVASAPFKLAGQTLGLQTGVGAEPLKQGFAASAEGGDASKAFLEGLRGNATPDQLVSQARDALGEVLQNRGETYQKMLASLGKDKTIYDISPIYSEVDNQLKKFGIIVGEDGLDFSRSKFALDSSAQKDIENLYNYVKGYGAKAGDRTAIGVDNLKQVLGGYYSPNSDYRAFVQGIKGATRKVLDAAPGYTDTMRNYSDMSEQIKDIRQSLSLGENAAAETTFRKLTNALKNSDFRQQVLQDLDSTTGGTLIPKIAGQRLSTIMPRGLAPYIEGGVGGLAGITAGSAGILPILGMMMTSSPRLVGEFVHALGVGARGTNALMGLLNKFATPTSAIGAGLLNHATSVTPQVGAPQGNQSNTQSGLIPSQ